MLNFTTGALPTRGRAEEYSRVLAHYYTALEPDRIVAAEIRENEVLNASSIGFDMGKLSCSVHRCNSPLHRYSMRRCSVQTGYSLQYIKEGPLTIVSDDNELHVQPGDLVFIRPLRILEYHAPAGGSKTIGVHIPLRALKPITYGREIAVDQVFPGNAGIGACVAALIETIVNCSSQLTSSDRLALQISLSEVMVQLGTSAMGPSVRAGVLQNLKAIATASLEDPELAPVEVAKSAGVSLRTLHRAFQESGQTFAAWVSEQRLERCHMELTDRSSLRRSITEVAFRWGFSELSTFDRNFRRRYGVSPREIRPATQIQG